MSAALDTGVAPAAVSASALEADAVRATAVADPSASAPGASLSAGRLAWDGARDITPMVIGVLPFALAIGAAVGASSLTTAEGLASGPAIFAGAAQLTVVEMLDSGAAPLVIVLSALMINARILLYSASLAPWFRGEPLRRRLLLAIPVIDQLQFTCVPRFEQGDLDGAGRRAYYAGAAVWLAGGFAVTQAAAIVVGAQVPDAARLEVAAPLALAGLLAKSTVGGRALVAAGVAVGTTIVGAGLPYRSTVLVAAVAGVTAGVVFDLLATGRTEGADQARKVGS